MIKVKRLVEDAILPTKSHPADAGFDLYSIDSYIIEPNTRRVISTGISIELPNRGISDQDIYARIAPRSGIAVKNGINVFAGVIDRGYTGEVLVCLYNSNKDQSFEIKKGDRIAQMIPTLIYTGDIMEVSNLDSTDRGDGGIGSTGN